MATAWGCLGTARGNTYSHMYYDVHVYAVKLGGSIDDVIITHSSVLVVASGDHIL